MSRFATWPGFRHLRAFVAEVPRSVEGYLNVAELRRALIVAALSGASVGGTLEMLRDQADGIVTHREDAAIASAALGFALEAWRRLHHGEMTVMMPAIVKGPWK